MRPLAGLSLFEALLALVAGGFVALFFAHFALGALQSHAFQKALAKAQEELDSARFVLTNHLREAFAPSLVLSPNSMQWHVPLFPYPLQLLPADNPDTYHIAQDIPQAPATLLAYCVDSAQTADATFQDGILSAALGACKWAYLLDSVPRSLHYDSAAQWLYIAPTGFGQEVSAFAIDANSGGIWLRMCVRPAALTRHACAHDANAEVCLQGLCGEWKAL